MSLLDTDIVIHDHILQRGAAFRERGAAFRALINVGKAWIIATVSYYKSIGLASGYHESYFQGPGRHT